MSPTTQKTTATPSIVTQSPSSPTQQTFAKHDDSVIKSPSIDSGSSSQTSTMIKTAAETVNENKEHSSRKDVTEGDGGKQEVVLRRKKKTSEESNQFEHSFSFEEDSIPGMYFVQYIFHAIASIL